MKLLAMGIPEAVLRQHSIVLGKTRSGKSSTMRLMVERMLDQSMPVTIIDPKGDWWGLKSSADGKHGGYPVVIFGGEHADVPLNAHAGAHVAELVATGNRPSIIDLGGWTVGDRTRFFVDFASALFRFTRGPRWLVIDEVHNFAPQGKVLDPDAGKMLHWANRLASEGAGKGLTLLAASQRPQKVHKDFITSCETLIAMRVIHPLDRRAVKDWIDGCPDAAKGADVMESIASMPRGSGWVWSPEIGFGPERVNFPKFKTYDSFKAQESEAQVKLAGWASVDLEDVRTKLAAVVKEAEANDPRKLRARIAQLERTQSELPRGASKTSLAEAEQRGFERGRIEAARVFREIGERAKQAIHVALGQLSISAGHVDSLVEASAKQFSPERVDRALGDRVERAVSGRPAPRGGGAPAEGLGNTGLRRMMIALAQRPRGLTRRQLGVRAGMSSSSGTFGTYLGKGRAEKWIEDAGDLIRITEAGVAALGSYDPLPEGRDLLAYWLSELGNSGASRLLKSLSEAYPDFLSREEAAARSNLSATSGTFGTYLGKLRALELVTGGSELRASEEFFGG